MKRIVNWEKASVCDIETDGFLNEVTKIHIVGIQLSGKDDVIYLGDETRIKNMLSYHIDNKIPIVFHNGILFDIPVIEKLYNIDLSELMIIDTLALSWYLNVNHKRHSVEALSKDYDTDLSKYQVAEGEWKNLSWDDAVLRVTGDVLLGRLIWEGFKSRLVDMYSLGKGVVDNGIKTSRLEGEVTYIDGKKGLSVSDWVCEILTFLMFKMDCARLQEKTGWNVDVDRVDEGIRVLGEKVEETKKILESVMPLVPKYTKRNKPKLMFKKDGTKSSSGEKWDLLLTNLKNKTKDENGFLLVRKNGEDIEQLYRVEKPNLDSHVQVKDFLFSKGWIPKTFDAKRDEKAFEEWIKTKPKKGARHNEWNEWKKRRPEDRLIPKITVAGDDGKELCESVSELAEDIPEVMHYAEYSTIKHRLAVLQGWKESLVDGKLQARIGGFSNTLRVKHREIVNLPATSRQYAEYIRSSLIAGDKCVLVGSDLSSLEDRIKHHFMLPLDPEYVETMMSPDYDPHLETALGAGFISRDDFIGYKNKTLDDANMARVALARAQGKTTNYASVYGAGAATIAKGAGVSLEDGQKLHDGYWKINWSVNAIADEQVVVKCSKGLSWLVNPINGLLYNIRTEKDIFSTLCQGTGSYMCDMWIDKHLNKQSSMWGACTQTASFHKSLWN